MDHTRCASFRVGDGNSNIGNTTNSYNTIFNGSDEDRQVMQWLSPLEPQNRHDGVRSDRQEDVGNWLLETNEFREWRSGEGGADKAVLFCHGNPGVGKTFLNCLVMDHLYDRARAEDIAVAGVYCDSGSEQEQTTANVMGAILKQLALKYENILGLVRTAFLMAKKESGRRLQLGDQVGMLRIAISSLPQVFICVDALDEFTSKNLPELLESLRAVILEIPSVRVFFTGRPHVEEQVTRFFTKGVTIPISPNANDIEIYVERKLKMDGDLYAMNDALRGDILRTIQEKVAETFLLVALIMDSILAEVTIADRRDKLNEMTTGKGLEDAYETTLKRMKLQKGGRSRLGLEALMWISYAERPLQASELCHALGVKIGSTDLDFENIPGIQTLLGCSLGLITFEKSSSTVRLVHYTLKEYLINNAVLFQSPHSMIAEVCLTYLNFRSIQDLSPTLDSVPSEVALVQYASCYWGSHARRKMTETANSLAIKVLGDFDQHISAQLLLSGYEKDRKWWEPRFRSQDGPTGFSGLHGAAYFGITETVAALLKMKQLDISATDCTGMTALIWAVKRGHEEVVKILLGRDDVNPDTADTNGRTPLSWAAAHGRDDVVKILLERKDVNPDTADTWGRAPLIWAAARSRDNVVKILLERKDVNPDTADSRGRTPLSWAAANGSDGVVKILLERKDVNPDTADTKGRTPLFWAIKYGRGDVVKILLGREDVNPDTADTKGRTPLSWAAANGSDGVVKILLERKDVNPDTADTWGQTPLSRAAANGRDDVVKILLERKDVNPDTADTYGWTPLSRAAANGRGDVVKILLERKDVNPNIAENSDGRTPLMWAAEKGYYKVIEMLLARHDLNPHAADFSGKTALSLATSNGHSAVVKLLSEHSHSLTNSSDIDEAPEHPSPELLDLPQPSSQPASPSPRLPVDSDTTPLGIDEASERAPPELFDLPSSVPLDPPQPTSQPIPPSVRPPADPYTTPPDSRSPLRTLFGSCICWNRHNSRR